MSLKKLHCVRYGDYFINTQNITFISCGETFKEENGLDSYQIYIHFSGGVESTMLHVEDITKAIEVLNS